MDFSKLDGHVPQVRHLLPLESIKIGLQRRRRILEILSRSLQRVFQLRKKSARIM